MYKMRKDLILFIVFIIFFLVRGICIFNIIDVKILLGWVRGYEENYESG